jgi:hypothetical protein
MRCSHSKKHEKHIITAWNRFEHHGAEDEDGASTSSEGPECEKGFMGELGELRHLRFGLQQQEWPTEHHSVGSAGLSNISRIGCGKGIQLHAFFLFLSGIRRFLLFRTSPDELRVDQEQVRERRWIGADDAAHHRQDGSQ